MHIKGIHFSRPPGLIDLATRHVSQFLAAPAALEPYQSSRSSWTARCVNKYLRRQQKISNDREP
jgi:hypothetical protein